jgi:type III pantothenate kinase
MLLCLDVGNTNITVAVFEGEHLKGSWRTATDTHKTVDDLGIWLVQLLQWQGIATQDIHQIIIASVVPGLEYTLKQVCKTYLNQQAIWATPGTIPIKVLLDNPAEIGADRLVNAYAVKAAYPLPAMVVDFGTATTIDVINEQGEYMGGIIAPGVNLSLDALYRAAARLPRITLTRPARFLGQSTTTAMQSGVYYGYAMMIEGLLMGLRQENFPDKLVSVIATGGLSSLFKDSIPSVGHQDTDLTTRGLALLARDM